MTPPTTYCAGVIQLRPMLEILMYSTYIPVPALRAQLADARSLRFLEGSSC